MKHKPALFLTMVALAVAILACQLPWNPTPTPTERLSDADTSTGVTKTATQSPTETAHPTATLTETTAPTEPAAPDLPVFPNPVIFDFSMFTTQDGWAVTQDGNALLATADGGQTWLNATPADLNPTPEGFVTHGINPFYLDKNTAWFTPNSISGGRLHHTQDRGVTWRNTSVPFERARYFFLTVNNGYALADLGAGAGSHYVALYQTSDSGLSWTEVFSHEPGETKSLPESGTKNGITFLDLNRGWIGGTIPMEDYFYLHITEDGGKTWSRMTDISLPGAYAGSLLDVWQPFFRTNTVSYLPVRALTSGGDSYLLIYRSADSGLSWDFQSAVSDGRSVDFYGLDAGWMAAGAAVLSTVDGGITWLPITGTGFPADETVLKVEAVDDQHGWALATPNPETLAPLRLYRTVDGGVHWSQLLP